MPRLFLHIRINQDNALEVIENGSPSQADEHTQSCNQVVSWESVDERIKSWVVQFVDEAGHELPPADSPFQHKETRFSATGSGHDQGHIKDCVGAGESRYKYTVSCIVNSGPQPLLLDPILVVSDPGGHSIEAIERLREIEQRLHILSRDLSDVAEQVSAIAADL